MRGASALGQLLERHPEADVRVIVVWEPVLEEDTGPPSDWVRAPLADPRVVEIWDPERWMSPRAVARAADYGVDFGPRGVAWDFVARYVPGAVWQEPFPDPAWWGTPVVDSLGPVEDQLGTPSHRPIRRR